MGKIRVFLAKFMKNKATNDRNSVKIKIFLGPTGARGVLQSHNACLSPCWLMALSDLYNLDSWSHKYCVLFRNQGVWSFLAMLISCRIFPHVVLPDTETGPMMPWRWPGISGALVISQEPEQKISKNQHYTITSNSCSDIMRRNQSDDILTSELRDNWLTLVTELG